MVFCKKANLDTTIISFFLRRVKHQWQQVICNDYLSTCFASKDIEY